MVMLTSAPELPTKPLNTIALYDADAASALAFVQRKLSDSEIPTNFTRQQITYIERLGGRASDLESVCIQCYSFFGRLDLMFTMQLIHKVRGGQSVEDAVEDIIVRGIGELRKNAFGDDAEDAKGLPWSAEQAWAILKLLSKQAEVRILSVKCISDLPSRSSRSHIMTFSLTFLSKATKVLFEAWNMPN